MDAAQEEEMKKGLQRGLLAMGACAALGAGLAGCGGAGDESEAKLVYWTMWNEAEPQGMVIAEAVEAFTEATGIEVEVNFNGREIRKTLQPALDAGEPIDVFDEDIERVLNSWGDYLLLLDEYVEQSYSTTDGQAVQRGGESNAPESCARAWRRHDKEYSVSAVCVCYDV